jgi:endonuclease/exonuclease/phosphatase family metal-dependent hydrolase
LPPHPDAPRSALARVPYQMDYLFASAALAKRLNSCEALDSAEWRSRSDHFPITATFGS